MSEGTFSVGNAERTPSGLRNLAEIQRALTTDDSWQAAVMEAAADRIEELERSLAFAHSVIAAAVDE